jgi:ABC-type nitrate/sulfonate/bicarbonate transport system substrate-binding protein
VAVALAVAACGGGDDATEGESRKIDVGYAFDFDAGDTSDRIAFDRLERTNGIRVAYRQMGGGPNTVAGLLRGDIDIGTLTLIDAVNAIDQGADIRVVLGQNMVMDLSLVARPDIERPEDLKGKRIAYPFPGATEIIARIALEKAGLDEDDAEFTSIGDSVRMAAALASGRVDAASLESLDFRRLLERKPGMSALVNMYELAPLGISTVWAVKREVVENNPELVQDLVSGLLDGYEYGHSAASRPTWVAKAKNSALEDDDRSFIEQTYEHYRKIGLWPRRDRPVTPQHHDRAVALWGRYGLIDGPARFREVWDISFWRKAAAG